MVRRLTDTELREKGWRALLERFSAVESMRFLRLMRNAPRNYQKWRDERFKGLTVDGLFKQAKARRRSRPRPAAK